MKLKWQRDGSGRWFAWDFTGSSDEGKPTLFRATRLEDGRWDLGIPFLIAPPQLTYPTLRACKVAASRIYRKATR
jgi:hypothetical protein